MSKPLIFISCGQFTTAEKALGKAIVEIVESVTGADAFFAEEVQDLNGLDTNILNALRNCAGFITVMHPRGTFKKPDGSRYTRASVWIEQEIAIATYIRRVEKQELPVIAFIHESVGREGIRDLLHLNPIYFRDESEILASLPSLLAKWKTIEPPGVNLSLSSYRRKNDWDGHFRMLNVHLWNHTKERISQLDMFIWFPRSIVHHGLDAEQPGFVEIGLKHHCFEVTEKQLEEPIRPGGGVFIFNQRYCLKCASEMGELDLAKETITARAFVGGREYVVEKTLQALIEDDQLI